MEITIEILQKRIQEYVVERQRLLDDAHAFDGAIQDCQHWITQLQEQQEVTVEK